MMLKNLLAEIEYDVSDVSREVLGLDVMRLTSDSREVGPKTLFVAIQGTHTDGHRFAEAAVERGAVAVLAERPIEVAVPTLRVSDGRGALAKAARSFYGAPDQSLTMIGVTGTNGKTTVSSLIHGVLVAARRNAAVLGTLGLRRGAVTRDTALTTPGPVELGAMLRELVDDGLEAMVMEVSSHALDQQRVAGVGFDAAVFTNLSRDHLDYHSTMEQYFEAKARLFRERRKPDGLVVVNVDDEHGRALANEFPGAWSFGKQEGARVRATAATQDADGIWLTIAVGGAKSASGQRTLNIRSPLIGDFNVSNILAAAATCLGLGIDDATIVRALEALSAIPGRLERVSGSEGPLVVVDYAHTPDALEKALAVLRPLTVGRLVCVMGCGGDRDQGKRSAMGAASAQGADFTFITNDNPRTEDPESIALSIERGFANTGARRGPDYDVVLDRQAAIERAIRGCTPGDAVLIAGKGHENYQIVGEERRHFDDREVAKSVLAQLGG